MKPSTSRSQKKKPPARPAPTTGEVLYGINPVQAALREGRRQLRRLYLKEARGAGRLAEMRALAEQRGLPIDTAPPQELARLCGSPDHQGAALHCGALPVRQERECSLPRAGERPVLLALDEVQDPRNLGAAIRCCAVFGIAGVVLPRHHAAPLSPTVSKASAGYLESFPIYEAANLARFLAAIRDKGYWVAGASPSGETALHTFSPDRPLVVVLGNERKGLRPLIEKQCDFRLAIRSAGEGSLNVAAAAAVLLYHLTLPR